MRNYIKSEMDVNFAKALKGRDDYSDTCNDIIAGWLD